MALRGAGDRSTVAPRAVWGGLLATIALVACSETPLESTSGTGGLASLKSAEYYGCDPAKPLCLPKPLDPIQQMAVYSAIMSMNCTAGKEAALELYNSGRILVYDM
jgi:hypothetical protein